MKKIESWLHCQVNKVGGVRVGSVLQGRQRFFLGPHAGVCEGKLLRRNVSLAIERSHTFYEPESFASFAAGAERVREV